METPFSSTIIKYEETAKASLKLPKWKLWIAKKLSIPVKQLCLFDFKVQVDNPIFQRHNIVLFGHEKFACMEVVDDVIWLTSVGPLDEHFKPDGSGVFVFASAFAEN